MLLDDLLRDREGGGRGRGRRVQHVEQGAVPLHDEVVDERAVARERLRTHAGRRADQVLGADRGDEALQGANERALREGAPCLSEPRAPVLREEAQCARVGQRAGEVARRDVPPAVTLAGEREHRVRAAFDPSADHAREVHPEEGEARIRDGVDESTHQMLCIRGELEVLAAERDDASRRGGTREMRDAVAVEPGAVDDEVEGASGLVLRGEANGAVLEPQLAYGSGEMERAALVGRQSIGDVPGDGVVVDDSRGRDVESRDSCDMWFDRVDLARAEERAVHAVGRSSLAQRVQPRKLGLVGRDDELPAAIVGEAVPGTVVLEQGSTADTEAGLEAVREVVEPAVNDPGVPAGLVQRDLGFLLEQRHRRPLRAFQELPGHREPHDPGADHRETAAMSCEGAFGHASEGVSGHRGAGSGRSSQRRGVFCSGLRPCVSTPYTARSGAEGDFLCGLLTGGCPSL